MPSLSNKERSHWKKVQKLISVPLPMFIPESRVFDKNLNNTGYFQSRYQKQRKIKIRKSKSKIKLEIFGDFQRFSENFRDFRKFSEIFRDFQRFSEIVRDFQRLSEITENQMLKTLK